ncbi:MAG: four helix bundle protein [Saprospiraceae bacterium]|nr:four helix bundle protein [Saprospiraceae bacterium]
MAKTYKELEIYKESFDLFLKTHRFTLKLPKHELYELGSQLRRSSDSINSNIVEGYGRNQYLKDFIKFLTFAYSSNNETLNHLKKLENLYPEFNIELTDLIKEYDKLGGKIYKFIEYVQSNWKT